MNKNHERNKSTMVLVVHEFGPDGQDVIYPIDTESMARFVDDANYNFDHGDIPKVSLTILTPKEMRAAKRLGKELA